MGSGIKRVYKRGKKAYHLALWEEGNSTRFHQWRKRAKYLRYQLRILWPIWPNYLKALEEEYHELTDLLGSEHDLSVLKELIIKEAITIRSSEERETLLAILHEHRSQLRQHALLLGGKLYVEKPAHFVRRIQRSWELHKQSLRMSATLVRSDDLQY